MYIYRFRMTYPTLYCFRFSSLNILISTTVWIRRFHLTWCVVVVEVAAVVGVRVGVVVVGVIHSTVWLLFFDGVGVALHRYINIYIFISSTNSRAFQQSVYGTWIEAKRTRRKKPNQIRITLHNSLYENVFRLY